MGRKNYFNWTERTIDILTGNVIRVTFNIP